MWRQHRKLCHGSHLKNGGYQKWQNFFTCTYSVNKIFRTDTHTHAPIHRQPGQVLYLWENFYQKLDIEIWIFTFKVQWIGSGAIISGGKSRIVLTPVLYTIAICVCMWIVCYNWINSVARAQQLLWACFTQSNKLCQQLNDWDSWLDALALTYGA